MKVAALIPCRTGSKGIPGKNFKVFGNWPLWYWTYKAAIGSDVFDKIIISSDGGFNFTSVEGAEIDNERPPELSDDATPSDDVLSYYMKKFPEYDLWCLLQPTSPLRTAGDIKKAYRMIKGKKYDSLVSVTWNPCMFWIEKAVGMKEKDYAIATYHVAKRPNRQDRKEWFMENGAIYFTKRYVFENCGARLGGCVGLYKMPKERSYEIDDPLDWELCEFLVKRGK
jgi:CMP-N-acetylneuraminic acid synthetase